MQYLVYRNWKRNWERKYRDGLTWLSRWKNILKLSMWSAVALFTAGFMLVLMVRLGVFGRIPSPKELSSVKNPTASLVFDDRGILLGKFFLENRTNVGYEDISPHIVDALISTEDARFYKHNGIDFRSWARVLVKNLLLFDRSAGGGSTISQQLAKNLFPRRHYWILSTPINKLREIFTALRIERIYTKEDILTLYLNTVPFGGQSYGVEVASQSFFNTLPKNLTIQDAAMLVGMLKATSYYNPRNNREAALIRRNTVLDQMANNGYLDTLERDSLRALPLETEYSREGHEHGIATYFREELRLFCQERLRDVRDEFGEPYNLYTDGLKIHTTIDSRLQRYAEASVRYRMRGLQELFDRHWQNGKPWRSDDILWDVVVRSKRYQSLKDRGLSMSAIDSIMQTPVPMTIFSWADTVVHMTMSPLDSIKYYLSLLHAGFLAADYRSGAIKAWVGGIDFAHFKYDHVRSTRQVGSTFKPILYAQALEQGYSPCDYFENGKITYEAYESWTPRNSNGNYEGFYSLEGALSQSVNTISVDLIFQVGIESVISRARQMGISSPIPEVPSIALGTADVSLFDMIQAYSVIANGGVFEPLHYIKRIENSRGDTILSFEAEQDTAVQVISEETAWTMTKLLRSVIEAGTGADLKTTYRVQGEVAGKTGTTQSHSDGWFIGFTPDIIAGTWVGASSPAVAFRTLQLGQGAFTALPIWAGFYNRATRSRTFSDWKYRQLEIPADIVARCNCPPYIDDAGPSFLEFLDREGEQILLDPERAIERARRKSRRKGAFRRLFENLFKKKNTSGNH